MKLTAIIEDGYYPKGYWDRHMDFRTGGGDISNGGATYVEDANTLTATTHESTGSCPSGQCGYKEVTRSYLKMSFVVSVCKKGAVEFSFGSRDVRVEEEDGELSVMQKNYWREGEERVTNNHWFYGSLDDQVARNLLQHCSKLL